MGPGAGVHGGEIVAQGTLNEVLANRNSLTADYLNGARQIPLPAKRRKGSGKKLTVHNARANNLQNVTASIPLGTFTCITGVSGSGKSSRSEEHTSELQSLMRISYAVFCLKQKKTTYTNQQ